jgi:hypothetical protein
VTCMPADGPVILKPPIVVLCIIISQSQQTQVTLSADTKTVGCMFQPNTVIIKLPVQCSRYMFITHD